MRCVLSSRVYRKVAVRARSTSSSADRFLPLGYNLLTLHFSRRLPAPRYRRMQSRNAFVCTFIRSFVRSRAGEEAARSRRFITGLLRRRIRSGLYEVSFTSRGCDASFTSFVRRKEKTGARRHSHESGATSAGPPPAIFHFPVERILSCRNSPWKLANTRSLGASDSPAA